MPSTYGFPGSCRLCHHHRVPIHLLRHAKAVDESAELSDESRYLTPRGREDARAIGRALAQLGIVPTAIVSSPLVRALQTAELVAGLCAPELAVTIDEALAPGRSLRRLLAGVAENEGAILVGHEPSISGLAAALTDRLHVATFKKAQLLRIEDAQPRWVLFPGDSVTRPCTS